MNNVVKKHFNPLRDELQGDGSRKKTKISTLFSLGRILASIGIFGAALVLLAYAADIELIWRPVADGPATSPLTAGLLLLCGISIVCIRTFRVTAVSVLLALTAGGIALLLLLQIIAGYRLIDSTGPFAYIMVREAAEGTPISTAWSSAITFMLISLSLLLRYAHRPRLAQSSALLALCFPLIALFGYSYGAQSFYGGMSVTTMTLSFLVGGASLLMSARTGLVRAISSPSETGRFSRLQVLFILFGIYVGGFIIQYMSDTRQIENIPAFAVFTSILTIITIGYFAITLEYNDQRRRRAERTIMQLATRDPMTGLFNRRFLLDQKSALVLFSRNQNYTLCVLMLDIDHFKSVNDTFGHPVGDEVIRQVARAVRARTRASDIAVRYGGEEMLICLLDVSHANAMRVAEDIRRIVEETDFPNMSDRKITVSIGVAEVFTDLDEAIGRADEALYAAKKAGRNRVIGDPTGRLRLRAETSSAA